MDLNTIDPKIPSTEYVFHRLFLISTSEEALRTHQELELRGAPSTGFAKYDSQLRGIERQAYLPISKMAVLVDKGYRVSLLREGDSKTIYEFIQYHLETWMQLIQNSINLTSAPYEDLRILDTFAEKVYGFAAHHYDRTTPQSAYTRFLATMPDLSDEAFGLGMSVDATQAPKIRPRVSLQEELMEHQARFLG